MLAVNVVVPEKVGLLTTPDGVMLLIVKEPFVTSLLIEIKNKIFKRKADGENV